MYTHEALRVFRLLAQFRQGTKPVSGLSHVMVVAGSSKDTTHVKRPVEEMVGNSVAA
jgi:hypothetical protein